MKRTWRKIGFAAVLLLTVNAGLKHWYLTTVLHGNIAIRTEAQLLESGRDTKTLILGDSHSKWGVDARLLDSAFNAALPGQSYMHDYHLLRSFTQRGLVKPEFLIIGADLHSFARRPGVRWGFMHFYSRYVDYIEEGQRQGSTLYFALREFLGRFAPYVAQRDNILHYFEFGVPIESQHMVALPMERGSVVFQGWYYGFSPERRLRDARRRVNIQLKGRKPFEDRAVEDFNRLLDLCRELKIRVLIVKFPMTEVFLTEAAKQVDIEAHDRRLGELLEGLQGVALLDARELFPTELKRFMDTTHLESSGAEQLTVDIDRALEDLAAQPW